MRFGAALLMVAVSMGPALAAGPIPVERSHAQVPDALTNAAPAAAPMPASEAAAADTVTPAPLPMNDAIAGAPAAEGTSDLLAAYDRAVAAMLAEPGDPECQFALGMAAFAAGKYPHAVMAYERVLMLVPGADRARLELARCYLAMGQAEPARRELQTVLEHDPPPAVRDNIRELLAQIDALAARWQFGGMLSTAWFYDDNVNAGLSSNQVVLNNLPYVMNDNALRHGDHGTILQGGLSAVRPLVGDPRWQFLAGMSAYQKWHMDYEDQDLTYLRGHAGLQFVHERWAAMAVGKHEFVIYDDRALVSMSGLEPAFMWQPRQDLRLVTAGTIEHRHHRTTVERSGNYYALGQTVRWVFDPREYALSAGARAFAEHATTRVNSNNGWEISAGMSFALPWQVQLEGRGARR
ncbi:MAG TPA: tetratricopeptide repeat protein, partial [bacterium]|nr:tetratricopeptide repeat protein [bacterium]